MQDGRQRDFNFFFSQKFQFLLKFKSRAEKSLSFSVFGVLFLWISFSLFVPEKMIQQNLSNRMSFWK